MTPEQKAVIVEAPSAYRKIMERAFSGNSKAAAIKGFCLRCVGYVRAEVKNCSAHSCPLHQYRPYQSESESDV